MRSMSLWNVAGPLHRPNGSKLNSNKPMVNRRLFFPCLLLPPPLASTPLTMSRVLNHLAPAKMSNVLHFYARKWVRISPGCSIDFSVINTKSHAPVLLGYQDDG